jgi:hypothetical protein
MTSCPRCFRARSSQRRSAAATSRGAASARGRVGWLSAACVVARHPFLFYEDMELCLAAAGEGVPTILQPDVAARRRRSPRGAAARRLTGRGATTPAVSCARGRLARGAGVRR